MKEETCKHCKYFYQHYVVDDMRRTPVNCGHCSKPRLKHRRPNTRACGNFREREGDVPLPDRPRVIDFLTVDMLEYILSLKLPPVMDKEEK